MGQRIIDLLNNSSSQAVTHYTEWFITSSITSITFGVVMIAIGIICLIKRWFDDGSKILVAVGILLGLLLIARQIPDLVAPEAAAIHQLIKDIRRN